MPIEDGQKFELLFAGKSEKFQTFQYYDEDYYELLVHPKSQWRSRVSFANKSQIEECPTAMRIEAVENENYQMEVHFSFFKPGSFAIFSAQLNNSQMRCAEIIAEDCLWENSKFRANLSQKLESLDSVALNKLLFCIENEEQEDLKRGIYKLNDSPDQFKFCGIFRENLLPGCFRNRNVRSPKSY